MRLYHHTLRRNLHSILSRGLLAGKSRGAIRGVWLHTSQWKASACKHMLSKRVGGMGEVVCLVVDVPRSWLRRLGGHKGMYYVLGDIPVSRLKGIVSYTVQEESL